MGFEALVELLPLLAPREAWAVGIVVVLAVLRPVGRVGWLAAGLLVAGAAASVATATVSSRAAPAAAAAWLALGGLLAVAAVRRPLRWEPRTGPGAATALVAGGLLVHAGLAARRGWAGLATLAAVALVVAGAERLGRRWGYIGTARCAAAAVAWSPPLVLAHGQAATVAAAAAALVWSWWALVEVWGGRHRSGRLAGLSGALLAVAGLLALWPLAVTPLWLRRLGIRTAGWFTAGALGVALAAAATVAVVAPAGAQLGVAPAGAQLGLAPLAAVLLVVGFTTVVTLALRRPLSPTRLAAMTGAILLAVVAWWPPDAAVSGPIAAIPFLVLSAVAPDRPGERWPPDADPRRLEVEVGV